MSFANYKKNRVVDVAALNARVEALDNSGKNKFKDDRFWTPTLDKAKNGSAVIRFLPAAESETDPWIQYHDHNFSENGTYLNEMCPGTLGKACPICEDNKPLWKESENGNEEAKEIVGRRKKKLHYISNILVIKDEANPEKEGKVFLYRYGTKIYEKIKLKMKPKDEEETPIIVFDFWEGADFRIDIKQVKNFNNYDDSSFRKQSALFKGDDKKLEEIYLKLYLLQPFVAEEKFSTYEKIQAKFIKVTTGAPAVKKAEDLFKQPNKTQKAGAQKKRDAKKEEEDLPPFDEKKAPPDDEVDVNDDDLSYYNNLVED